MPSANGLVCKREALFNVECCMYERRGLRVVCDICLPIAIICFCMLYVWLGDLVVLAAPVNCYQHC